jgi:hypothetical protein
MLERGLEDFAVVVDRRIGVVEEFQRCLGGYRALAQQQRQHQAGGRGADRRGEQVFGVAHELEIGLGLGVECEAAARGVAVERCPRPLLAEVAGHGRAELLDRHRRTPQAEARGDRCQVGGDEQVALQPLDRRRRASQREADIGNDIEAQAPDHAVQQRRQLEPEQRLRPQQGEPQRSFAQQGEGDDAGVGKARQQQRVGPHHDADHHAGDGAARGGALPEQAAEERRGELRDGGERQEPDGGKLRRAGRAVVEIRQQQDDDDRYAPHR